MDILKGNLQDTPAKPIHRDQCEMIRNNQFGLPSEKLAELEESYDVSPVALSIKFRVAGLFPNG